MNGNFMSENPPCDFLCPNPTKGSQIHANYSYMYEKAHQPPAVSLSWVMYVKGEGMIICLGNQNVILVSKQFMGWLPRRHFYPNFL